MSNIVKYLSAPNKLYFSIRMPKYKNLFDKTDPIYKMISYNNDAMFGEQSNSGWESEGYQLGSAEWTQVMNEGAYTPQDGEMFTNQNMIETNRKPSGLQVILETAHHRHTSMSSWHGYYEASANSTSVMHAWKREVTSFDKKLKKQRFTSNLHQLMQKSVQARKNRIIGRMNGQS